MRPVVAGRTSSHVTSAWSPAPRQCHRAGQERPHPPREARRGSRRLRPFPSRVRAGRRRRRLDRPLHRMVGRAHVGWIRITSGAPRNSTRPEIGPFAYRALRSWPSATRTASRSRIGSNTASQRSRPIWSPAGSDSSCLRDAPSGPCSTWTPRKTTNARCATERRRPPTCFYGGSSSIALMASRRTSRVRRLRLRPTGCRFGASLAFAPDVVVWHPTRDRARPFLRAQWLYCRGFAVREGRAGRMPQDLRLRSLVPFVSVARSRRWWGSPTALIVAGSARTAWYRHGTRR